MPKYLKLFLLSLLAAVVLFSSCGKNPFGGGGGCDPGPQMKALNFVVLDRNGNSLISTLKDSVAVTYQEVNTSNAVHTLRLTINKNYTNYPADTTSVSAKYNGLYITDNAQLSVLSSQSPAINTFNLSINGKSMGVIYINYSNYQMSYPNLTVDAFTFNNTQAVLDASTNNNLELLKLQ